MFKIRGFNRKIRQIDEWRQKNRSLDLEDCLSGGVDRYHAMTGVPPWNGIAVTLSSVPEPAFIF